MKYSIKEIADINRNSLKKEELKKEELKKIVYLDTANLTKNKINELVDYDTKTDKVPSRAKRKVEDNDILISTVRPNQEHYGILKNTPDNLIVSTGFAVITPKSDLVDPYYLYAVLTQKKITNYLQVVAENSTSAYPSIKPSIIANLEIDLLTLNKQKSIGKFFKSLEYKIELNNQIISNLEELASTLFKRWFVDFEFPDENGNPYKSSGGKMVDSELGEIPEGWHIDIISNLMENFDRKRVPLSKMQREKRKGEYPYYGAASLMDYVDDFLFDGIHLLLGEDGTVITKEGNPVLQYVWGKFWVNNHAHVLKGRGYVSTEWLYLWFKQTNVSGIVTGAVQPKISQTNLNRLKVVFPDKELLIKFQKNIGIMFDKLVVLSNEMTTLTELRDTLLPRLLSGEIELSEDGEV
ncbi:restriction endonuclease subunit S [Enterococcus faecalis]|uniref:restriction endonuclease subunit S n=1 Tax=Enterococcus faecalis TaxID=1351 RepID=UPI0019264275|nr:restriction endonuclease subunit S [Enterococcus faecalis]